MTRKLQGTLAGTVSIPEFFAPEHVIQIVAGASAPGTAPQGPDLSM